MSDQECKLTRIERQVFENYIMDHHIKVYRAWWADNQSVSRLLSLCAWVSVNHPEILDQWQKENTNEHN